MKLGPCSDLEPTLNSWSPFLTIICMITLPLEELNLLYGLTFQKWILYLPKVSRGEKKS